MNGLKKILFAVFVIGFSMTMSGCYIVGVPARHHPAYEPSEPAPPPWAPAHGFRAKHRYHYYPSASVYVDVTRNLFFYCSGGQWLAAASLPAEIHVDLSDYVALEMDTDRPYQFHREVTRKYPPGQQKKKWKAKKGK